MRLRGDRELAAAVAILPRPLNLVVEAVEKTLPKNRSHNARKTTAQNALHSTLRRLGGVKGPRNLAFIIGKILFLHPRLGLNGSIHVVTCYLRYVLDPFKLKEFEIYGKMWIPLV